MAMSWYGVSQVFWGLFHTAPPYSGPLFAQKQQQFTKLRRFDVGKCRVLDFNLFGPFLRTES